MSDQFHDNTCNPRHCRRHRPVLNHYTGSDATGNQTAPPRSQERQHQSAEHDSRQLERLQLETANVNLKTAYVRLWGGSVYVAAAVLAVALFFGRALLPVFADTAPPPANPTATTQQPSAPLSAADNESGS